MSAGVFALSAEQIAFIEGEVTIYAAATGADLLPQVVRGAGCRVDARNRTVMIFVSAANASALLTALRHRGALAAVFAQPGSHKALQLKSESASIVSLGRDDAVFIANYRERMIAHIAPFGFASDVLRALFSLPVSDAVALQFTPCAVFDQTPGPNAGAMVSLPA